VGPDSRQSESLRVNTLRLLEASAFKWSCSALGSRRISAGAGASVFSESNTLLGWLAVTGDAKFTTGQTQDVARQSSPQRADASVVMYSATEASRSEILRLSRPRGCLRLKGTPRA
jgi:hypothetical protein